MLLLAAFGVSQNGSYEAKVLKCVFSKPILKSLPHKTLFTELVTAREIKVTIRIEYTKIGRN